MFRHTFGESTDKPIDDQLSHEEIGYGRPPTRTQFKKGQSGNPSGRPKEKSTPKDIFNKIFNTPLRVKVDGQPKYITGTQAVLLQIRARCMKGDLVAVRLLFQLYRDMDLLSQPEDNGKLDELIAVLKQ